MHTKVLFSTFLYKNNNSMPMKYNITQPTNQQKKDKRNNKSKSELKPSLQTLTFLKMFARNYHVEPSMPDGLQGIILG